MEKHPRSPQLRPSRPGDEAFIPGSGLSSPRSSAIVYQLLLGAGSCPRGHLGHLFRPERRRRGTPRGVSALTCFRHAAMVLGWFCDGTRVGQLARDFGISIATAHQYLREGIAVLSAQAPACTRSSTVPGVPACPRPPRRLFDPHRPRRREGPCNSLHTRLCAVGNASWPCSKPDGRPSSTSSSTPAESATSPVPAWFSPASNTTELTEPFQHCRSRVRTAAAIDDIRFGLHRALRKMRQNFRHATSCSTGARAAENARMLRWVRACGQVVGAVGQRG